MNKIEPTKITLEFYNKKISAKVDHADLTVEKLHDMWLEIVRAMRYHENNRKEFYE